MARRYEHVLLGFTGSCGRQPALLANEDAKRVAHHGVVTAGRIAAIGARIALALLMAGLGAAQPRLLPLFALTLAFWIAIELESKAPRSGRDTRSE